MDNRKDCKWIEIFLNAYGDRVEKCLCHLYPDSRRVDMERDCANCEHYRKEEEDS